MLRIVAVFLLILGIVAPEGLAAHEINFGALTVIHPWARATAPGASTGVVYLVIENTGTDADRLIGAETPRARQASFHESALVNEVMTMRELEAVRLGPKDIVSFEPEGLHVMLFGLKAPLQAGETFPLTLQFEKAGRLTVDVIVEQNEPMGHQHHHDAAGKTQK